MRKNRGREDRRKERHKIELENGRGRKKKASAASEYKGARNENKGGRRIASTTKSGEPIAIARETRICGRKGRERRKKLEIGKGIRAGIAVHGSVQEQEFRMAEGISIVTTTANIRREKGGRKDNGSARRRDT